MGWISGGSGRKPWIEHKSSTAPHDARTRTAAPQQPTVLHEHCLQAQSLVFLRLAVTNRHPLGLAIPIYDHGDYQPINAVRLESGIRIAPGKSLTIQAPERLTWSCSGSGMEVHYTLTGYYALP